MRLYGEQLLKTDELYTIVSSVSDASLRNMDLKRHINPWQADNINIQPKQKTRAYHMACERYAETYTIGLVSVTETWGIWVNKGIELAANMNQNKAN